MKKMLQKTRGRREQNCRLDDKLLKCVETKETRADEETIKHIGNHDEDLEKVNIKQDESNYKLGEALESSGPKVLGGLFHNYHIQ